MKVLFLAAGFGTRLKEKGIHMPKGLIEYKGTPLIERLYSQVKRLKNVDEVVLITNHKFYDHYHDWSTDLGLSQLNLIDNGISKSENRYGALKDLLTVIHKHDWWDENVFVLPSDTYINFSLDHLVDFFGKDRKFTTVLRQMPTKKDIANRLGCAVVSDEMITEFVEKPANPPSLFAAIPFYLYTPSSLKLLAAFEKNSESNLDAPGSIIPWLLENNQPVRAFVTQKPTLDVGTPKDVEALQDF